MGNLADKNAEFSMWHTVVAPIGLGWPGQTKSTDLLLPSWQTLPPLPPCLSGFAPNRNHNADAFEALAQTLPLPQKQEPVLGLFCADPFLSADIALRAFQAHGSLRVINFPTVAMLGSEFNATANEVGAGIDAEITFLKDLQSRGRKVGFAATCKEDIERWGDEAADFCMVLPSYEAVQDGRIDVVDQLKAAREIVEAATFPVILMSPAENISAYAAEKTGASGLIAF